MERDVMIRHHQGVKLRAQFPVWDHALRNTSNYRSGLLTGRRPRLSQTHLAHGHPIDRCNPNRLSELAVEGAQSRSWGASTWGPHLKLTREAVMTILGVTNLLFAGTTAITRRMHRTATADRDGR